MVEHPAVNRRVVGSNPTCGAYAGMVELVDTTDLKSVDRKVVRVQVPLKALGLLAQLVRASDS